MTKQSKIGTSVIPCAVVSAAPASPLAGAAPLNPGAVAREAQSVDGAGYTHTLEVTTPRARTFSAKAAPNRETSMPCLECNGEGEAEYMGLDETHYTMRDCHVCDGTGLVAPYCETCEGKLVDGWCASCEDYGLVYVERIAPGRVVV